MKKSRSGGASPAELRLRAELDNTRRELRKARAALGIGPDGKESRAAGADAGDVDESDAASPSGMEATLAAASVDIHADARRQIAELTEARQRLSRLYFQQVEENRRRQNKLHEVLENLWAIGTERDVDLLLQRVADGIQRHLGYGSVVVRLREPGTGLLRARAFAGLDASAREARMAEVVSLQEFQSWQRDEPRVGRSTFVSRRPRHGNGGAPEPGAMQELEWQAGDVLLVPVTNPRAELVACLAVENPADRLVPSRESVELLEVIANHAAAAIENARLLRQFETHMEQLEADGRRMRESHALKSNFISTVSHELRTPLSAIRAYVDTLLAAREGDMSYEQTRKFLGIVNEESQRLARLIESMLDLNRFDSGPLPFVRQKMDLGEILEDAVGWLKPLAETGQVALKLQIAGADTGVEADRDQMRQLAVHLGGNAVKFTPAGGQVTLRLSGDERDIMLEVEDTGIGIPEPQLEKVFDRFYQADSSLARRTGGSGLGLSICKSIVEWHGGRIFAESTPGMGSRFTVVLPRRSGPRAAVRAQARAAEHDVLRLAIEMVSEVMGARVVSLMAPGARGELVVQAAVGFGEEMLLDGSLAPGRGVAGWVATHRRPVCVSNPQAVDEAERGGAGSGTGTFLSVPLEGADGLLGVLSVTDAAGERPFDAEDCHLLLHLAERVAAAWEEARSLEKSRRDLEGTTRALKRVLAHLEQGRRSAPDRVRLARALAREVGLPETEVGLVSYAASVHDLGMSRVSDEVQEGAVPLSPEARLSLERHPEVSAELLRPLEAMGAVRDIVLSHHEWWDGTGYPRGLRGEAIPVGGRILAVVDAYESMTVGRSHRAAVTHEAALVELRELRGRQFDPAVVDAFERAWGAVRDEKAGTATGVRNAEPAPRG